MRVSCVVIVLLLSLLYCAYGYALFVVGMCPSPYMYVCLCPLIFLTHASVLVQCRATNAWSIIENLSIGNLVSATSITVESKEGQMTNVLVNVDNGTLPLAISGNVAVSAGVADEQVTTTASIKNLVIERVRFAEVCHDTANALGARAGS